MAAKSNSATNRVGQHFIGCFAANKVRYSNQQVVDQSFWLRCLTLQDKQAEMLAAEGVYPYRQSICQTTSVAYAAYSDCYLPASSCYPGCLLSHYTTPLRHWLDSAAELCCWYLPCCLLLPWQSYLSLSTPSSLHSISCYAIASLLLVSDICQTMLMTHNRRSSVAAPEGC